MPLPMVKRISDQFFPMQNFKIGKEQITSLKLLFESEVPAAVPILFNKLYFDGNSLKDLEMA